MQAFLLILAEKLVEKYGRDLFVLMRDWLRKREEQKIAKKNLAVLKQAIESKDLDAIKKSNDASLNNTSN